MQLLRAGKVISAIIVPTSSHIPVKMLHDKTDLNNKRPTKTCLIIHGGAMKAAIAAGFVYGLAQQGIKHFDTVVGVSISGNVVQAPR